MSMSRRISTHVGELREVAAEIDGLISKALFLGLEYNKYAIDSNFEVDDARYIALNGKLYQYVNHSEINNLRTEIERLPNGNLKFYSSFYDDNGECYRECGNLQSQLQRELHNKGIK